jgi:prephenate dehydrogenase
MEKSLPFRRAAILGTGLIGGSFGLALGKYFPAISTVGFDRSEVLKRAIDRGAIKEEATTLEQAVLDADLVYVALPIDQMFGILELLAALCYPKALITDVASAKRRLCHFERHFLSTRARLLSGHPMAGREVSGIDNANADLFAGAPYALIGSEADANSDPRVQNFVSVIHGIGAHPVWCDAETHDWAVGVVSHLPQLVALALARVVSDETDETGLPLTLAGRGLQNSLRLAGSPYEIWRDIFFDNRENLARALDRLIQAVEHLRTNLSSKELEEEFRVANELFRSLRNEQQKTER